MVCGFWVSSSGILGALGAWCLCVMGFDFGLSLRDLRVGVCLCCISTICVWVALIGDLSLVGVGGFCGLVFWLF